MAVCTATLLARPCAAQDRVPFSPHALLADYEQCYFGDYSRLYDFDPFEARAGERVTAEELAQLRAQWQAERDRVAKRVDRIESDPAARQLYRIEHRVMVHPFFKEIDYELIGEDEVFPFFVERPRKTNPRYHDRLKRKFHPWLNALEQVFVREFASPLQLAHEGTVRCYPIAILSDKGSYQNFSRAVPSQSLRWARAHFDARQELSVTYEDPFVREEHAEALRAILHEAVHALQKGHYSGPGVMPRPVWFNEGLADYLAVQDGSTPAVLGEHKIDAEQVALLAEVMHSKAVGYVAGMADLVAIEGPGYTNVFRYAQARLGGRPADTKVFIESALAVFYAQASVAVHFLRHGLQGKYRAGFGEYVRAVQRGAHGVAAFTEALGGVALADLDREFVAYVRAQYTAARPDQELPSAPTLRSVGPLRDPDDPAADGGEVTEATAGDAADDTLDVVPPDLDAFQLKDHEWEAELALALAEAGRGAFQPAATRLRRLAPPDGEAKARVQRALRRLQTVYQLRSEILSKGQFIRVETEARPVRGNVVRIEDGVIHLERGGRDYQVSLRDFDADDLVREAKRAKKPTPDWLPPYLLYLQDGDAAAAAARCDGDADSRALKDDLAAAGHYRTLATVAESLAQFSTGPLPEEAAAAMALVDEVSGLRRRHADLALVAEREQPLKQLQRALVARAFDPVDPRCLGVAADVERLDGDRVRLRWDFAGGGSEDFEAVEGYPRTVILAGEDPLSTSITAESGTLSILGTTCVRLRLPFAAPFQVRFQLRLGGETTFIAGVCDDGKGNFIGIDLFGNVLPRRGATVRNADDRPVLVAGDTYTVEYHHAGETFTTRIGRKDRGNLRGTTLPQQGMLFFWLHAPHLVEIDEMTIEATLDDASLAAAKRRWLEVNGG